jgi:hypothetical protein
MTHKVMLMLTLMTLKMCHKKDSVKLTALID